MLSKLVNYSKFYRRIRLVRRLMNEVDRQASVLVPDEAEATIDRFAEKTAFLFEGETLTFGGFDARANRVANWALVEGFKPGDTIALVMENCPDYVAIWLGLSKVGVVTALINANLEGSGLAHCIAIVDAKAIIASGNQTDNVRAVLPVLAGAPTLWDMDGRSGSNFSKALVFPV